MSKNDITKETQLISRCRAGDTKAFAQLIFPYKDSLYTYLLRLSGNNANAEDLFQETMVKIWRGLKKYKEQNKFSSWLFSIAHNVSLDYFRKMKKEKNDVSISEILSLKSDKDPYDQLVNKEMEAQLIKSLMRLPDKQREVFLLRLNGNLSFKEIAELTEEPLNTVLSHMHYAVKKLKFILRNENAA